MIRTRLVECELCRTDRRIIAQRRICRPSSWRPHPDDTSDILTWHSSDALHASWCKTDWLAGWCHRQPYVYSHVLLFPPAIINRRATMGRCTPRDASRWRSLTGSTWFVTRIKIYFTLNWVTPRLRGRLIRRPVIVRVIIRLEVRSSTYLMQVATQNEMTIAWHGKRIQFLWTPHLDRLFLILYGTWRF